MRGADFYGIQRVLLRYAELPNLGFFPFSVQHGWQHAASRFEADGEPLEIWAWSNRIKRDMERFYPAEKIRVIGSPYLYLTEVCAAPETEVSPARSLYVLPHSSHFTRIGFSLEDLRRLLDEISCSDGGCDVLVYYLDVNEELSALLKTVGAKMVVNGGLWSSDFLYACRNNFRRYRKIYHSAFGSAVLFAIHEGRETLYVELESRLERSHNRYVDSLHKDFPFDPTGRGFDAAAELGVDQKLSPGELRDLIVGGIRRGSYIGFQKQVLFNCKNRMIDFWRNVRPAEQLVARHNA